MIPVRHFVSPEIAALAERMRALIEHSMMTTWLNAVVPTAYFDYDGQSCQDWLRARARELPWLDRTLASHDGRPLHRLPAYSRRWAVIAARGFLALCIVPEFKRAAAEAEAVQGAAAWLLEYVRKIVGLLEAHAETAERRP